ncbi:hypothetical protein AA12717_0378 [Gluconacetobacter sacchari DSM 12717]|uniref:MarR family transcriptional regulator n=2 Tax=Gluconacetobacter sacchari TaxID=92759 RepID=A0A7W4IC07_9PROT|nr:MarR family transcriptional regulator [Gluconacetobacter sacchari]MBB2160105.1 MarR family transcriptional regulator [Gluconacetobacter sacchari]GBQ19869.1 hypothetical protein AA12717_0378 [Gluconacetobacter sacchari DSM 12717]
MNAPEPIAFLVDAAGEDVVLCFLEAEGGKQIWVPARGAGTQLADVYGDELAAAICRRHGRSPWTVPMCKAWRVTLYRQRGMTVADIAMRCGLSVRQVHQIIANARASGIVVRRPAKPADPRQAILL